MKIPDNQISNVKVDQESISVSRSEKLLGIVVNDTLDWSNHLYGDDNNKGLIRTLNQRIGILKQLRRFMNPKSFISMLNGIFYSKLTYGLTVWGSVSGIPGQIYHSKAGLTKLDIQRLQSIQNKAVRLINYHDRYVSTKRLLRDTNQLSINQLTAYNIALLTYKIKISQKPEYHFRRLFKTNIDPRTRSENLNLVDFKKNIGRNSFFYQASRLWSKIPKDVKDCSTVDEFKKCCRKWIVEIIPTKP